MTIFEKDNEYIANTYARFPVHISLGKGALLFAGDGKEYIDLTSGIGVNAFGACDPIWVEAVTEQLNKLQHISNLYYTEPCVKLAELLCEKTGMKKVFFSNSGAEANECAIKAARLYGTNSGRYKIVTLNNSFHGRTITTLAATGQDTFHTDFTPLTEGFVYSPANDCEALEKIVEAENPIAIYFETIQGEGGVLPLKPEFVETIVKLCEKNDILCIVDEVQTGNGRTGALYGYMHYGITPDIVTTAKGLGGGLPIGATLFAEKTANLFKPGLHGSTFGGNPVSCAGALSILSRLDNELFDAVNKKSLFIMEQLADCKNIVNITGKGLMLGISTTKPSGDIINACLERGVMLLKAKDKIRLLPPLNIEMPLLKKAITILREEIER